MDVVSEIYVVFMCDHGDFVASSLIEIGNEGPRLDPSDGTVAVDCSIVFDRAIGIGDRVV
jgi:hypothetical protein